MTGEQIVWEFAARRHATTGTGRTIRNAAGVPMSTIAKVIGVSVPTLSRWETAITTPSGPEAATWAELLSRLDAATRVEVAVPA